MAEGLNRVTLLGNLGQDPELRMTQGGQALLKMRLATTETYADRNGQRQERTEWHSVTLWGKRAEALAKFLSKGSTILVEGSLRTDSYEKNGEKRYQTVVNAQNIVLVGGRRSGGDGGEGGSGYRGGEGEGGSSYRGGGRPSQSTQRQAPSSGDGGGDFGGDRDRDGDGGGGGPSDDDFPF